MSRRHRWSWALNRTKLVLLVPLNVTYPDKCGKNQPVDAAMPRYLLLSDQGLGQMKWVKDETSVKLAWCLITRLMLFGWCKLQTPGLKIKMKCGMHILACKMQKAAALGLVNISFFCLDTGRGSEQTSVEMRPLASDYSPVMCCHRSAFKTLSFCLIFLLISLRFPKWFGFTRKNAGKLTSLSHWLDLVQPCFNGLPAVQYNLVSHVLNANFNVPPSQMLWKMESDTVMLRLLSNPQLNKRGGHLQVEMLRCLSLKAIHLPPFPPVDPVPLSCKREAKARVHHRYT